MIVPPALNPDEVEVVRGPNIRPLPINKPMGENVAGQVLLKVGDNITTDHIMPAGAKVLPLRSNIPAISEYVFEKVDPSGHGDQVALRKMQNRVQRRRRVEALPVVPKAQIAKAPAIAKAQRWDDGIACRKTT